MPRRVNAPVYMLSTLATLPETGGPLRVFFRKERVSSVHVFCEEHDLGELRVRWKLGGGRRDVPVCKIKEMLVEKFSWCSTTGFWRAERGVREKEISRNRWVKFLR